MGIPPLFNTSLVYPFENNKKKERLYKILQMWYSRKNIDKKGGKELFC